MTYSLTNADLALRSAVWWNGTPIPGYDSKVWMRDIAGRPMKFCEHGNRDSEYGWEIDHIIPVCRGGSDNLANLQPLNWNSNCKKGDQSPWTPC